MLSSPQRRLIKESDVEKRKLERSSIGGDIEAGARFIKKKLRSGELSEQNVRIAAGIGDKSAKMLFPDARHLNFFRDLEAIIDSSDLSVEQMANFLADCIERSFITHRHLESFNKKPHISLSHHTDPDQSITTISGVVITALNVLRKFDRTRANGVREDTFILWRETFFSGSLYWILSSLYSALKIVDDNAISYKSFSEALFHILEAGHGWLRAQECYVDYLLGRA